MILLQGATKRFGSRIAVHPLDLEVPRGRVFGLLGHNGAGKSTTIGMLLGQVFPDEGRLFIDGFDVFADRRRALARVGAIFETPAFYEYLSGLANLRIFCGYSSPVNEKRLKQVVELVGLEGRIQDRVSAYSHGMRQRLALAQALLPDPELLILDEPGDGLDPEGIHEMRNLVLKLNREWGLTILFSSHLLGEVEKMCTHLALLREGRLVYAGEWNSSLQDRRMIRVRVDRQSEAESGLCRQGLVTRFEGEGRGEPAPGKSIAAIAEWLVSNGFQIEAIAPVEQTLEDFYLKTIRTGNRVGNPSS